MANVLYNEGEKIKTVKHKDLKAGDVFCYPFETSSPSIMMKINVRGVLHTINLRTGLYFDDTNLNCLEADVIKLDALIFASSDNSKEGAT